MNTKETWLEECIRLTRQPSKYYKINTRKIFRNQRIVFDQLDNSLQLSDVGYTSAKLKQLERMYLHKESRDTAARLWSMYRKAAGKNNYESVGFTTYNHLIKTQDKKRRRGVSVMGPCMTGVTITLLSKERAAIDVFYRTADLLRKFPADLVFLRDVLLKPFDLKGMNYTVTCHFANITVAMTYYVVLIPHFGDMMLIEMDEVFYDDEVFYKYAVMWTAQYLCREYNRGVDRYSQTRQMKNHALRTITGPQLKRLQTYLRNNHPGYKFEYKRRLDQC